MAWPYRPGASRCAAASCGRKGAEQHAGRSGRRSCVLCMLLEHRRTSDCLAASRSIAWPPAMPRGAAGRGERADHLQLRCAARRHAGSSASIWKARTAARRRPGGRSPRRKRDVAGRPAAPQVVVVHARQVVVHQRVGVDQLDRRGRAIRAARVATPRPRPRVDQQRPHALAAAEHRVAHGASCSRAGGAGSFLRQRSRVVVRAC